MEAEFDVTEKFVENGPIVEGAIYGNSRILPDKRALFDEEMVDMTARYQVTDETD